ncbi:hypothetical protein [Pseudomonas azerbaijanoccidentalis]
MSRDKQQAEQVALDVVDAVLGGAVLKDVQGISEHRPSRQRATARALQCHGR